jgi:response regulator of citrate/malate metabolism
MAKKVLIIEDDAKMCEILNNYCVAMEKFSSIVTTTDGHAACAKLDNLKFDIILLDINIPRLSGIEVLSTIVNNKRPINKAGNCIIISGVLEKENIEKIVKLGCRNFLVKPFNEASFKDKVLSLLKQQKENS